MLPDLSPRFTCKVNSSNTKNLASFFILASLLDKGLSWRVCFLKVYFGIIQSSIVSQTEQQLMQIQYMNMSICFPSLIYCDWTWLLFLGVQIRLLTRCKICFTLGLSNYFSLKSLSLCLKSHMNVPWSVDYKFIVWCKLWIFKRELCC